ncbi:helix-turn-helix domain-containing protein [Micromonospora sp. C28SCA-DRY-2]|uniref:helix-turn-helix domain-containing protein n=1 Tax=Micromonospora sp. C28SCA-DRY-2 TaxID=3059522 RepID=UPI00267632C1|nr:helix-turn-helix domain-containing protein [Micromonospora sp. C28SCA-DRY-2]MDO3702795.1 helix-turn-helix domain-containing protein [Micromonospora sp. C28SCA-DRY-2]
MLEVIGLSAEAELIYERLLDGGPATAGELATATCLSDQQVRKALHDLAERGLTRHTSESPICYTAVDPDVVLDILLLRREEEIKRARVRASQLSERFRLAAARQDPSQLVEVVTGREAVLEWSLNIVRSARKELRGLDKPPYATRQFGGTATSLVQPGATVRTIYEQAAVETRGGITGDIAEGARLGEQDRVLPHLPTKLIIADDRIAIIPLQAAPDVLESAAVIHPSALLEAIAAMFEALWRVALPLDLAWSGAADANQPSQEDRHILALLTTGLPDDAIARQLGLSDRTYQRRMRSLMERAEARTRFQLARQAARRGWLSDPVEPPPETRPHRSTTAGR